MEIFLWFIPLSTKVDKYQKIIDKKILKYGECKNIIIGEIFHERVAILIQNAFPTIEKYIDHVHVFAGEPARVSNELKDEILKCFKHLMRLKKYGKNLFFVDIDRIEKMMREELEDKIKN